MNARYLFEYVCLVVLTQCGFADSVLSPNPHSIGHSSYGPFFITESLAGSTRFQEVHGAVDFRSVGSPMFITEFALWRGLGSDPIDVTLPSIVIHFSTTAGVPHQLSSTFAGNIGPDEASVFSGALHLVDTGGEFGISIPLQTPFYYDPQRGNLLMDIWNYDTIPDPGGYGINWQGTWSDSVSGLSTVRNAGELSGALYDGGMITRFTVIPVPEPSPWLLLVVGMAVIVLFRVFCSRIARSAP